MVSFLCIKYTTFFWVIFGKNVDHTILISFKSAAVIPKDNVALNLIRIFNKLYIIDNQAIKRNYRGKFF
jgi:hypothetical protein